MTERGKKDKITQIWLIIGEGIIKRPLADIEKEGIEIIMAMIVKKRRRKNHPVKTNSMMMQMTIEI